MTKTNYLVDKLRGLARNCTTRFEDRCADAMEEAADEIERYERQVADLEAECDAMYRAAILKRPWWWRFVGLDHVSPETRQRETARTS
jgi:hypothetical protein